MRFVAKRDTAKRFRFTPIQSGYGARLARAFGIDPDDPDTNAVIHGGEAFMKSDAALTVLSLLPGWEKIYSGQNSVIFQRRPAGSAS